MQQTNRLDHKLVVNDTSLEYKDMSSQAKRDCSDLESVNFFHKRTELAAANIDLNNTLWLQV